jgi:hypothetical protein
MDKEVVSSHAPFVRYRQDVAGLQVLGRPSAVQALSATCNLWQASALSCSVETSPNKNTPSITRGLVESPYAIASSRDSATSIKKSSSLERCQSMPVLGTPTHATRSPGTSFQTFNPPAIAGYPWKRGSLSQLMISAICYRLYPRIRMATTNKHRAPI